MKKFFVKEKDGLFRVMDRDTKSVALHSQTGAELDGGGHTDNQKAARQAGYVEMAWDKKQEEEAANGN